MYQYTFIISGSERSYTFRVFLNVHHHIFVSRWLKLYCKIRYCMLCWILALFKFHFVNCMCIVCIALHCLAFKLYGSIESLGQMLNNYQRVNVSYTCHNIFITLLFTTVIFYNGRLSFLEIITMEFTKHWTNFFCIGNLKTINPNDSSITSSKNLVALGKYFHVH